MLHYSTTIMETITNIKTTYNDETTMTMKTISHRHGNANTFTQTQHLIIFFTEGKIQNLMTIEF